jgi:chromosome segregation ATPase
MNLVIVQKNQEMAKFKEKQEEKVMNMEELLSAEKIFNKNSINHKMKTLNNTILEYKNSLNSSKTKLGTLEKTNSELKSKELFLERELKISTQKNEKLNNDYIELTNELRQKHKDNAYLSKLLEQIKKDKVESIKLLNSTHQSKLDYLNEKLNQLSESIREKENEDSKKYQQYIKMQEQYTYITKEKEIYIQQIKELNFDLQEKNKKIDELLLTQTQGTKSNTNDLNLTLDNNDIIYFKKIEKGLRCIFVPFYENIFVCINLSENMLKENDNNTGPLSNYECKYILDLNSFNNDLSKIIVDNSLIVIGQISKLTEIEQSKNKLLNLPEDKNFILATLGKVDYVIGFPENELMFNNYIN